jgi:hypothetical protein
MLHAHIGVLPGRAGRESGHVFAEHVQEPELVPALERRFDRGDEHVPVVVAGQFAAGPEPQDRAGHI